MSYTVIVGKLKDINGASCVLANIPETKVKNRSTYIQIIWKKNKK